MKNEYLHIRCTPREKEVAQERASRCGLSLSVFVLSYLYGDKEVLASARSPSFTRTLSDEDTMVKNSQIQVRVSEEEKAHLARKATRSGLKFSKFIREAIIYGREDLVK